MKKCTLHIIWIILTAVPVLGYSSGEKPRVTQADTITVYVLGTHEDARFEPDLIKIRPGDIIRFLVKEGIHTVTAYHPDNRRPLGIPEDADSFDSGILQPGDIWFLTLQTEGEYNYFCLPHEKIGHTGMINVTSAPLLSTQKSKNP